MVIMMKKVVIMIPCYKPDEKFLIHLDNLKENGFDKIIVINDGSGESYDHFFIETEEKYGCKVVAHSINLGQGRAYKTGFNYYLSETRAGGCYEGSIGIIQCDCDGQHHIEDIIKCESLLIENPRKFILGVRDFSDKNIPFRSRFGNIFTTFVFKFFCGLDIKDTQTGLKGIPASFIPTLMETPGERFEYASSVLIETKKHGVEIVQFPIKTIYINENETSHFNPVLDSIRIYSQILRYLLSSLSSFVLDIILFRLFLGVFRNIFPIYYVLISTYLSRVILCVYVFFFNKNAVFHSHEKLLTPAIKFFSLCVVQATVSGFTVREVVAFFHWGEVISKIIVDTLLFFVSFQVQGKWVFVSKSVGKEKNNEC